MNTRRFVLLITCLIAAAPAFAATTLIRPVAAAEKGGLVARLPEAVLRRDVVKLDPRQVVADGRGNPELTLNLFPDVTVRASLLRFEPHGERTSHWHGRAADDPASMVVLTVAEGRLVGTVAYRNRRYLIAWLPSGNYGIAEVDVEAMPENDSLRPSHQGLDRGGDAIPFGKEGGHPGLGLDTSKWWDTEVDIMVLWSSDVNGITACDLYSKVFVNGLLDCYQLYVSMPDWKPIIEGVLIPHAIAEANFVFAGSGLGTPLNLVHALPVGFAGSGNLEQDRLDLENGVGILGLVSPIRDAHKADIVMLVTYHSDYSSCGNAHLKEKLDFSEAKWAYGVVSAECLFGPGFTFSHELGHIFGAHHDWYAFQDLMIGGTTLPARTYAHGHTVMPQGLMTIMAYRNECLDKGGLVCARVPWFSDGGTYGQPELTPRPADNARMISESLWFVANYR